MEIDISITPDDMKVDASGFEGTTCLDELAEMTAAMEKAGITSNVSNQDMKGDHYERETESIRQ